MDGGNLEIVRGAYEAVGRGDMEMVVQVFQNTEWVEADGMPYGGVYHGSEAILQNVFGPLAADVQDFTARPDELLGVGNDRVLALGKYGGQGAKGALEVSFAHLWRVREGKIVRFVQYADTHKFRQAVRG